MQMKHRNPINKVFFLAGKLVLLIILALVAILAAQATYFKPGLGSCAGRNYGNISGGFVRGRLASRCQSCSPSGIAPLVRC